MERRPNPNLALSDNYEARQLALKAGFSEARVEQRTHTIMRSKEQFASMALRSVEWMLDKELHQIFVQSVQDVLESHFGSRSSYPLTATANFLIAKKQSK